MSWNDKDMFCKSECESTLGEGNTPVERAPRSYLDTIREQYGKEIYERAGMYDEDELDAARRILKKLIAQDPETVAAKLQDEPVETVKGLRAALACIKEEQRRRWRK